MMGFSPFLYFEITLANPWGKTPPIMHVVETHEQSQESLVYNDVELLFNVSVIPHSLPHTPNSFSQI
jgi:hypothetical protein